MRAQVNDTVVAEADDVDIITIEGNAYFPPGSLTDGVFKKSATPYTCPWKGAAQYWDLTTAAGVTGDGAWSYPEPFQGGIDRVGQDFSGYVAFDRASVRVSA